MKRLLNIALSALFAIYMIIKVISLVDGGGDGSDNSKTSEHSGEVRQRETGSTSAITVDRDVLSGVFYYDSQNFDQIFDTISDGARRKAASLGLSRQQLEALLEPLKIILSVPEEQKLTFSKDGEFTSKGTILFDRPEEFSGKWKRIGDDLFSLALHFADDEEDVSEVVIQRDGDNLMLIEVAKENHPNPYETLYGLATLLEIDPQKVAKRFSPAKKQEQFSERTDRDFFGKYTLDHELRNKNVKTIIEASDVLTPDIIKVFPLLPNNAKISLDISAEHNTFKLAVTLPFQPQQSATGTWRVEGGFIRFAFDGKTELSRKYVDDSILMGGYRLGDDLYIISLPSSNQDFYSLTPFDLAVYLGQNVLTLAMKFVRD